MPLDAVVTVPTTNPAPVIAVVAAACVSPTTFGTDTGAGPVDTTMFTAEPTFTLVPAVGLWLITSPDGTVLLDAVVTVPTTNPAPVIAVVAAACVSPTTFGTLTFAGPVDTTMFTAEPTFTLVPAVGLWLITSPDGTVLLDAVVTVPTTNPAPVIAVVAAACVSPTTFGTLTFAGPVDITRFTADPAATLVPATGLWLITSPDGTVLLDAVVTVPTTNPAPVIAVVAAACVSPTTFGTDTGAGPVDTTMFTAEPAATLVPATGLWLITSPDGTVLLDAVVTVPTTNPAPVIAVVAAACVSPTTFGTDTGAGPVDTTMFTAEPTFTLVPAVGLWLITSPDGTVLLDAVVTVPTTNPAPVIAVVAAACVSPTTFGTLTFAGPVDITRFTADPAATLVPATGLWLITSPDGTVLLDAVVTVPTTNPAPVIAVVAAACVSPTTFGTDTGAGPVDTTMFTAEPAATLVPATGLWLITSPDGTVLLDAVVTVPTTNPAPVIAVVAAACVSPTTFGTDTGAGPVDTTMFTAEPAATLVPAVGLWLITSPDGTVLLDAVVTVPTTNPAPVIAVVAAACVSPTTFGTDTGAGPVDTTMFTAEPTFTLVPAVGLWLITSPDGTVLLDAVVTVPTTNPAPVIAVVAAACVSPTTFGTLTFTGPVDITRFTADPAATLVPATGLWLITSPDGTVLLDAVVTVPTTNPAPVIAVVAAACVSPTTFGTDTGAGPVDTTMFTAEPAATLVPATGLWLITSPDGTVLLDAVVTVPTTNPAPVIAVVAAACVSPTTFGTDTGAGPVDTTMFTAEPTFTLVPATGLWLITSPDGTVLLDAVVTVPTTNPAPVIAVVAAACVSPTTFGTLTFAGPVDITRFTADPAATLVPATGLWLITSPDGTVLLDAVVTVPTTNPAPVIAVVAAACVSPTTFGTDTGAGPVDTTMFTAEPAATLVPATGLWLITSPDGTVLLDAVVTVPTTNPAPVIAVVAAACVSPTTFGTDTGAGPVDTTMFTAEPTFTLVPATGLWLITSPDGTVLLDAVVTVPTTNPAPVIAVVAAACVSPTTFGTDAVIVKPPVNDAISAPV